MRIAGIFKNVYISCLLITVLITYPKFHPCHRHPPGIKFPFPGKYIHLQKAFYTIHPASSRRKIGRYPTQAAYFQGTLGPKIPKLTQLHAIFYSMVWIDSRIGYSLAKEHVSSGRH